MSEHEVANRLVAAPDSWSARLLRRLLSNLRFGSLVVILPDGERLRFEGRQPGPEGEIRIHSSKVLRKSLLRGDVGFAEAFMDGDWDSPDLVSLLEVLVRNEDAVRELDEGAWFKRMVLSLGHALNGNSRRGSRRNIAHHYDLGNDFYSLWLDETLAYSSAVFASPGQSLHAAQMNKFHLMLQRLDLRPEHHLLEIGSGWGGFALYAARESGCRVTSITLSQAQAAEARQRAAAEGLSDRVEFRLQDYRDVREQYDRVVSIEMYEAVGERYWSQYFSTLHRVLKPGGLAAIQGITIDEQIFPLYRRQVDFIQKYIFPGGMLASKPVFMDHAAHAGLRVQDPQYYGQHYAETLNHWRQRVRKVQESILHQFDERFLRMWRYYLAYCEAGFRLGRIDLMQVTLHKPD
jgi:cyclopropane-fatty-acyl-phospholipid synthase